jgi:hypothetical protein
LDVATAIVSDAATASCPIISANTCYPASTAVVSGAATAGRPAISAYT